MTDGCNHKHMRNTSSYDNSASLLCPLNICQSKGLAEDMETSHFNLQARNKEQKKQMETSQSAGISSCMQSAAGCANPAAQSGNYVGNSWNTMQYCCYHDKKSLKNLCWRSFSHYNFFHIIMKYQMIQFSCHIIKHSVHTIPIHLLCKKWHVHWEGSQLSWKTWKRKHLENDLFCPGNENFKLYCSPSLRLPTRRSKTRCVYSLELDCC